MNDIKFRAWDKIEKRMLYRSVWDRNWYATPKNDEGGCHCVRGISPDDQHKMELMQYTGLVDRKGVQICEGDIVYHDEDYKGQSETNTQWRTGTAQVVRCGMGFCFKEIDCGEWRFNGPEGEEWRIEQMEVVGNIYCDEMKTIGVKK